MQKFHRTLAGVISSMEISLSIMVCLGGYLQVLVKKWGRWRNRNGVVAIQSNLDDNNSHLRIKMDWP
jgi:hypothetical protein